VSAQLINALRGHLAEIGVITAQGHNAAGELARRIEARDETITTCVCEALAPLVDRSLMRKAKPMRLRGA
jgi:hypothetical protein